jgi:hypothetical protein
MKNRVLAAIIAIMAMLAAASSAAQATPGNGAATHFHSFVCDGQLLTFIIEGGTGNWSPAYVVETGKTFVPTSFTFNGTLLAAKRGPLPQTQVTCTETLPDGTLTLTGYFVPPTG